MNFPDVIFSAGIDRALGWTVLHSVWQFTVIALLGGILLLLMRNRSARARYRVTMAAIFSILLCATATFCLYYQANEPVIEANAQVSKAGFLNQAAVLTPTAPSVLQPEGEQKPAETIWSGAFFSGFRDYFGAQLPMIVLLWFLGMAVFLLRFIGLVLQVQGMRRRMNFHADPYWGELLGRLVQKAGFNQHIDLLESALVRSPLTIGHFKPVILFPIGLINRLSEQEVEAILAHELAHILRRDYFFNILQSLVEALFYYHPAVWWLSAQARNERESACDDMAVALLGNQINYAKALVAIQEMAFYPLTAALAVTGGRRSQFMMRLQRLFSQPKTTFNMREKLIATCLVVCSVAVLALGQHIQNQQRTKETVAETSSHNTGIWEAELDKDSVCLTFTSKTKYGTWNNGSCYLKSAFSNFPTSTGDVNFDMTRPAGIMRLTGKIDDKSGYGRYEFTPDETYRKSFQDAGMKDMDDDLMLQCFFANFPANYLKSLHKLGFNEVSHDQLMQLAAFELDEPAVKKYQDLASSLGKKDLDLDALVQLKIFNVNTAQINQLEKAGYKNLQIEEISQLSALGVDVDYINAMNALGGSKLTVDELIGAKAQGIDAEYIKQARSMGLGELSFEEIQSAKALGIDADYVKQCQNLGLGKLRYDEIQSAKALGIDEAYVKQCQSWGVGALRFDEIMSAKAQGIDREYIEKFKTLGLKNLRFDELMSAKAMDIDAAYIKQCREWFGAQIEFEEIVAAKAQGIDADDIKAGQNLGLGKLEFEDFINIKVHEILPAFVQGFRDAGLKNLTMDDIIGAKVQDVTPAFIKEADQKGYRFPNLGEYIDLKVRLSMRQGGSQR
jgi:beta-lactamase regulating signal transducer with metallopeptidase domain